MFHVKHSPIEKLPATLRTTLYQLMYFRIYDLNRECRNQIRDLPPSTCRDAFRSICAGPVSTG